MYVYMRHEHIQRFSILQLLQSSCFREAPWFELEQVWTLGVGGISNGIWECLRMSLAFNTLASLTKHLGFKNLDSITVRKCQARLPPRKTEDGPHLCFNIPVDQHCHQQVGFWVTSKQPWNRKHPGRGSRSPELFWTSHGVPAIKCFGEDRMTISTNDFKAKDLALQIINMFHGDQAGLEYLAIRFQTNPQFGHMMSYIPGADAEMAQYLWQEVYRVEATSTLMQGSFCVWLSVGLFVGTGWMLISDGLWADFKEDLPARCSYPMPWKNMNKYIKIQCTSNQCSAVCGGHVWSFDVCAGIIICHDSGGGRRGDLCWNGGANRELVEGDVKFG